MGFIPEEYFLTDRQIDDAWFGSWHNNPDKRDIIREALLTYSGGYICGYTITQICISLKLLTKKSTPNNPRLSKYGRKVMFWMNYEAIRKR